MHELRMGKISTLSLASVCGVAGEVQVGVGVWEGSRSERCVCLGADRAGTQRTLHGLGLRSDG